MKTATPSAPPPDPSTSQRRSATDIEPRCWRCNKKLAELLSRPWTIVCARCKARNQGAAPEISSAPR